MKILLTIIIALTSFMGHAVIIQVNDMKDFVDAFLEADSRSLVVFDVDMVLVQPSEPAFQMANMKRFSGICKKIFKELPPDKQMLFLSLMTVSSNAELIDSRIPSFLEKLIEKKIPAIALTANLTGKLGSISSMEEWRVGSLRQVGIDFSQTSPYPSSIVFDNLASYRGNHPALLDGIFFVNGTLVSKGDAFLALIEKSNFLPYKVFFIDDSEDNLKSVEEAVQKLNKSIEFYGFHYLGAKEYQSKEVSELEFQTQWEKLANQAKELN